MVVNNRETAASLVVSLPDRHARCGVCGVAVGEFDHDGKLHLGPEYSALKRKPVYMNPRYGVSQHERKRAAIRKAQGQGIPTRFAPAPRAREFVVIDLQDDETRWPLECASCKSWNSIIPKVRKPNG